MSSGDKSPHYKHIPDRPRGQRLQAMNEKQSANQLPPIILTWPRASLCFRRSGTESENRKCQGVFTLCPSPLPLPGRLLAHPPPSFPPLPPPPLPPLSGSTIARFCFYLVLWKRTLVDLKSHCASLSAWALKVESVNAFYWVNILSYAFWKILLAIFFFSRSTEVTFFAAEFLISHSRKVDSVRIFKHKAILELFRNYYQ